MFRLLFQSVLTLSRGIYTCVLGVLQHQVFLISCSYFQKEIWAMLAAIKSLSYVPYLQAKNTTLPFFSDPSHRLSWHHAFCAILCLFSSKQQQEPLDNCASLSTFSKFSPRRAQWWAVWWHALNSSVMTCRFNVQTNNSPTDTKRKSCMGTVIPSVSCLSLVWENHPSHLCGTVQSGTSSQKKTYWWRKTLFRMDEHYVSNK